MGIKSAPSGSDHTPLIPVGKPLPHSGNVATPFQGTTKPGASTMGSLHPDPTAHLSRTSKKPTNLVFGPMTSKPEGVPGGNR